MFDDLSDIYDAIVDWPKRLAHEGPFYRRLFERHKVRSVLDVACGTGRHAAMFQSWGLQVEAADVSPSMIERARRLFGEQPGLRWVVRGFDENIPNVEPFDAAICVGNSLPLADDMATVEKALRQMLAAVHQGGVLVVQVLNLWRLPDGPCFWQKSQRANLPEGEALIIKGVHRCGSRGYVELIVTPAVGGSFAKTESVQLLGFNAAELESMTHAAGGSDIRFFGGYQDQPYEREKSTDLLMVAQRQ